MEKGKVFKLVWRGWFVGVSAIFTPLFILGLLVEPSFEAVPLYGVILVPVIAAFQGVMAGGLVCLGLAIWPQRTES
ncbi:MAG: hypothetical protein DHS20C09_11950 [marine bacterium B5-7]|nr:MAG: hypothetical protein DHS20C09_11950 [marine bacterium B5-7]